MKRYEMQLAGYEHLSCDEQARIHRLLNIQTREIEIWQVTSRQPGIVYGDTYLTFICLEEDYKKGGIT